MSIQDKDCWPAKQSRLSLWPFLSGESQIDETIEGTLCFFTFNKSFQVLSKALWEVLRNRREGEIFCKGLDSTWGFYLLKDDFFSRRFCFLYTHSPFPASAHFLLLPLCGYTSFVTPLEDSAPLTSFRSRSTHGMHVAVKKGVRGFESESDLSKVMPMVYSLGYRKVTEGESQCPVNCKTPSTFHFFLLATASRGRIREANWRPLHWFLLGTHQEGTGTIQTLKLGLS